MKYLIEMSMVIESEEIKSAEELEKEVQRDIEHDGSVSDFSVKVTVLQD